MKPIEFEIGQRVRCTPDCGDRSGMLGTIIGLKAIRYGFGADGKLGLMSYRVEWDDGVWTPATQQALEPAPPVRGDLDTKVTWKRFDPELAFVIRNGTNRDY